MHIHFAFAALIFFKSETLFSSGLTLHEKILTSFCRVSALRAVSRFYHFLTKLLFYVESHRVTGSHFSYLPRSNFLALRLTNEEALINYFFVG